MSETESPLDRAIRIAGGLSALGRKLREPVSHEAVRKWRDGIVPLSPDRAIQIEEALRGQVRRRELLPPELFEEPVYPASMESAAATGVDSKAAEGALRG